MAIRFRKLCKFRLVVNVRIGNPKAGHSAGHVGFDIADACDFGQIASDRGGTGPSDHVGDFETHERGRGSIGLGGGCRVGRRRFGDVRLARTTNDRQQSNR